jgi:hypothetical protein
MSNVEFRRGRRKEATRENGFRGRDIPGDEEHGFAMGRDAVSPWFNLNA